MKASPESKVCEFYDSTADSYAEMMDVEINLPMYSDVLGRLAQRIAAIGGPVVDTSCGSGHMLSRYRELFERDRSLVGMDLSPRMVALAKVKLGPAADVRTGDMRSLGHLESVSSAAVMSFFALHHLDADEVLPAFEVWRRVLRPGGQLVVATWEGTGPIDYGEEADIVALRYGESEIRDWAVAAGYVVDRCAVEPVEGMPMKAVYLEGTRE